MELSIAKVAEFKDRVDYKPYCRLEHIQPIETLARNFNIADFAQRSFRSRTLGELQRLANSFAYCFGVGHFGIAVAKPVHVAKYACHHVYSTPCKWITHYQKHLLFLDPFTNYSIENVKPSIWVRNGRSERILQSIAAEMLSAVSHFSVGQILTLPCHGPSGEIGSIRIINFLSSAWQEEEIDRFLPMAIASGTYLMDALIRITALATVSRKQQAMLSKREIEVLKWICTGLAASEIGNKLHISENTVLTHTKSLYRKLQVHNRPQAIARAVALNLFTW